MIWKLNTNGRIGQASGQFIVDKVDDSRRRDRNGHPQCNLISDFIETYVSATSEQPNAEHRADEAAVKRHAAMPDRDNLERILKIV